MAPQRLLTGATLFTAIVLAACSSPISSPSPSSIDTLHQAYTTLLDNYVDPLDPTVLALGATTGMTSSLVRHQVAVQPGDIAVFAPGTREQTWQQLQQSYVTLATTYAKQDDPQTLAYDAIRSMAASVNDCHTAFSSPAEAADEQALLQGTAKFGGIGAYLLDQPGDPPAIREVFANGPADKAGVLPGDIIERVNGTSVFDLSSHDVASLIRGPEGSTVALAINRRGLDFTIPVVRQQVSPPVITAKMLTVSQYRIAYLRIYSFPSSLMNWVDPALTQLQQKGAQAWIVDLRDNGGGDLDSLRALAGRFLHRGPLDGLLDRRGKVSYVQPSGNVMAHPQPLAVVVNDGSASASEMFAAAVQEQGAGKVVGDRTLGCFGVAQEVKLRDGSGLQYKIDNVISGLQGVPLDGNGVTPDVQIGLTTTDLAATRDPQLGAGLQSVVTQLGS